MDVGNRLLLSLVQQQNAMEFMRYQLHADLFYGGEEAVFEFVTAHVTKHHKLPALTTVQEKFPELHKVPEPPEFYLAQVEQRYTHKQLNKALLDANALMKDQDTYAALDMVDKLVQRMRQRQLTSLVSDFVAGASDMVMDEIVRIKKLGEDAGMKLGWPTFDRMSGGLRGGDIVSIIGRPAMGKTWFLLYIAHYLWKHKQNDVMVVSMEMDTLSISQRIAGITSQVSTTNLRLAELTTVEMTRLAKAIKGVKAHPSHLWIMDGNLHAEVDQIITVANQMRPHVLLIDGAYLLGHPDRRLDKNKRVDANVELIKRRASEMRIPMVLSYQFNRQAVKKYKGKKDEGGALEDIAYSDAIGQVSSAVLAMHQEDSVETAKQRIINVLKCRTMLKGSFPVHWDFQKMDFSEAIPEKPSEMKFI